MKTPVKRSQSSSADHSCARRCPYVNEPVPDEDWLKSYREKSNHDERLKQLQQRLDSSEELSKW
jgi:acyl carrier protein phosphodiesterase